ncbi:hypothetical protein [Shinella sumterensis]|uniref:Uncharacterized protein n=1 Tax=Shinella sumterensis TaxID=1967501 RepID=A0AA50H5B0_9HYPH|nr:hypothetical protein [Shinella sumterensis]WLR98744.1 hypothetical protein Q9313_06905 [Shinella sumterensis]
MKKGEPNSWQGSTQWRMISREAIRKWNAKRASLPKCGARRKRDGASCMQLAGENGRCYYHGLRTGKGAKYHVHILPNGDAPDFEAKLHRKLRQIERDKKAQAKRRAAMNPEQLAAHQRWHETHTPGPAAARANKRQDRQQAKELRQRIENDKPRPVSPELAELQAQVAALEERRAHYLRLAEEQHQPEDNGVFD